MSKIMSTVGRAIAALQQGDPVLVFDSDDREGEADMIYAAESLTAEDVARLRNDAGGLVCTAISYEVAETFDLPYLDDSIDHPASKDLDLGYDERSSFSLSVNHRDTFTGITDEDRARTITAIGDAAADPSGTTFAEEFRAPGHVSLLKAAPNGLDDREGHTEMGVALAKAAGCAPAAVVCEMLDDTTGDALSKADVRDYASRRNIPYVEGSEIIPELR